MGLPARRHLSTPQRPQRGRPVLARRLGVPLVLEVNASGAGPKGGSRFAERLAVITERAARGADRLVLT
jgi:hypothetical protein